ncbi:MAG: hypothetical protein ABII90_08175 [Bacteroidota bacterium]
MDDPDDVLCEGSPSPPAGGRAGLPCGIPVSRNIHTGGEVAVPYKHTIIKSYSNILGTPSQTQDSNSLIKSIWDDSTTRFEYIKQSGKDKSLVYSALYDKKLWEKIYK